jgi:aspartyl-tRNA(Asn)/glutamyl-tRNA(Gln) amidotransferase subunit B
MIITNSEPELLAKSMGLKQDNDPEALKAVVKKIIADNPDQVQEFIAGKETLMKFFVGMAMKETKGSGNPKILTELFIDSMK